MKYFLVFLVLIGFVGIPHSDAFNGGGMVIEVPGQTMDISQTIISPGETMFVNGSFKQPVDDFTTNIFKNYEDSRKLVLTINPTTNEFGDFNFNFTIPEHWELGNYYMILENGLQFMDWEFTVRQNHSGGILDRTVYPVPWMIESPLKQTKSGVSFNEIQCKENLVLLQKYDGSPTCVTEKTKQRLIERGWTNAELDTYVLKYSPVLFNGTGVDLRGDDLIEHLKNKREQLHIAIDEIGVKALYPITGMSFSVGHNAYSLDEKYVGTPVALDIHVLKEKFTKEILEEVNQLVRKYVGDEIDIVYSKGGYAVPDIASR